MIGKKFKQPDPHAVIHATMAAAYTASCIGVEKGLAAAVIAGCYTALMLLTH